MKSAESHETATAVSPVTTVPATGQDAGAPGTVSQDQAAAAGQQPGARRRWTARAAGVLRYHWLAALLLLAGLVLRILAQLAYRPALFLDAVRYLYDAYGNDPVGYEGPLRAILFVGNLNAVVAVQHLLGLAMGLVIYLLLLRRGANRWLAALAMAPVLLDAYQLQDEQTIMPGTFFQLMVITGIVVLLWQPRPGWTRTIIGGAALGTSAIIAQVGESLLLPALIYVLVVAGGGWHRTLARAAVLCVSFAVPILAYCTGSYLITGEFFLSHTGVTSVYGRLASAVDCATIKLPADERAMCPTLAQQVRGPDWLEYADGSPIRPYYDNLPRDQVNNLIADFNHRVLTQQPQRVLGRYSIDVVKLYAVTRVQMPGDTPISRWQFQTTFPYHPPHATAPVVSQVVARFGGGQPAVWTPVASFLRAYQLHGGFTPGPLLLLFTVTGVAGSVIGLLRRRAPPQIRQPALACLLFFGSSAAVTLVADLFEFSWRYQLPALIALVPAGVLGIMAILRSVKAPRSANGGGTASSL
jgi:hypothetical protein